MTTMDSDSESQDSDDGRRFRFEATRKDSGSSLNSRKRKSSPARRNTSRRSRSRDRGNRERSRHDHRKELNKRVEGNSRDRDGKNLKNFHEHSRGNNWRYEKNSLNNRDGNFRSSRESRNHEKNREEDKICPDKHKGRNSNLENSSRKHFCRERFGEPSRSEKVEKSRKIDTKNRSNDDEKKIIPKILGKDENLKNSQETSAKQECKDLNLSDFDIVSDTEENSSENSYSRKMEKSEKRDEMSFSESERGGLMKKRVSKQRYERFLMRRELKNRHSSDELRQNVKVENCEKLPTSNNNRSTDFLLGHDELTLKKNVDIDMSDDDNNKLETSSEDLECRYGPDLSQKIAQGQRGQSNEKIEIIQGQSCQRDEIKEKNNEPQGETIEKLIAQGHRGQRDEKREIIDVSQGHRGENSGKIIFQGQRDNRDDMSDKNYSSQGQRGRKDKINEKGHFSQGQSGENDEFGDKINISKGQKDPKGENIEKLIAQGHRGENQGKTVFQGQSGEKNEFDDNINILKDPKDENIENFLQKRTKEKKRIIGPTLPENLRLNEHMEIVDEEIFGPALPPHLTSQSNVEIESKAEIFDSILSDDEDEKIIDEMKNIRSESEGEDFMGPLPVDHPALENDFVQQQLERRARRLKAELSACDNENEKKREEWMIELPPAQSVNLGLGPRKFRSRPAPDMSDRSSWTDTPADRARKRMEKLENKNICEPTVSGQREISSGTPEKSKKREKSLLEIHQKKLNKKKKKEEKEAKKIGKKVERRPFDRDVDLQANRFDEAQKKNIFMKARELDDKFSRGKI